MQLPITLDPEHGPTLQSQIVGALRALIEEGRLAPGSPVPTSRELSKQLGVSRNTVSGAYDALAGHGYLYTEPAVGTFVSKVLPDFFMSPRSFAAETLEARPGGLYRSLNLPLPYTGRGLPGLHRPTRSGITVDFVFGRMAPASFPDKIWRRILGECTGGAAERMSEYGDPAGIPELRQLITNHLGPSRGMVVSSEQVLLVAGFQQGINLAAHLFVSSNTPVVMEAPCYRGAAFLFESYGGRLIPVPVDQHGIDVQRLPTHRVKLVYVSPSHQFPTGVTMPLHRRLALLEWAAKTGAYILEVDHDAEFRYVGSPLPSLYSLDRNGCVIYLNSFSRSLGPGLRIGYMVVPRGLIQPALTVKSLMDNGLPWLDQACLARFIRDGSWEAHVKRLRQANQRRRDVMLEALLRHIPRAEVTGADAGTHLYLTLPPGGPTALQVQQTCLRSGVAVHPLEDSPVWFWEHREDHERGLLLGYTHLSEERLRAGVAVLGAAALDSQPSAQG